METEYELTERLVRALVDRPSFQGIVLFFDMSTGERSKYFALAKSPNMEMRDAAQLAGSLVDRTSDPQDMRTEDLILAIRDRPGFRGVVVQEHGAEAESELGHTKIQFDVSHDLPPRKAASILRCAASQLDGMPGRGA